MYKKCVDKNIILKVLLSKPHTLINCSLMINSLITQEILVKNIFAYAYHS